MQSSNKTAHDGKTNRTGLAMSPHAEEMLEVTMMTVQSTNQGALQKEQAHYLKAAHALGSIPPPDTAKGKMKAAWEAVKGNKASVFVDKLAERLAFERTGTRLYDAMLAKMRVEKKFPDGPTLKAVTQIRDEEQAHAQMLADTIEQLGADPTAMTPSADLVGVEGMGLGKVLNDPRTTVGQCLHALIIAELADNEGWTMLRTLAEEMGQNALAKRFTQAEEDEQRHLEQVRAWREAYTKAEAT